MTDKKIILGFIGELASGKGAACAYLNKKYEANIYRFSTMLRDVLNRMYLDISRENLQKVSTALRENFGQDVMSQVIAEDVKKDTKNLVAVDGVRRPTDITYLKKNPAFHLVYITTDKKLRWERLAKRNENIGDDKKTFEDFLRDEKAEAETQIQKLGEQAPYVINNNGGFNELYAQLETILTKIKNESKN